MSEQASCWAGWTLFALGTIGLCSNTLGWSSPSPSPILLTSLTGSGPGAASKDDVNCEEWMALDLDIASGSECESGTAPPNAPCVTCADLNENNLGHFPSDTQVETYGWNSPQYYSPCGRKTIGVCSFGACLGTPGGPCTDLVRYVQQTGPGGPG